MNIAILGAGNIGGTLGRKWLAGGESVVFGVRDAASPKAQALQTALQETLGRPAELLDLAAALNRSQVVLFATPWAAAGEIATAQRSALAGKLLIDATNQFAGPVMNNLAAFSAIPGATVYRAFNTLGWEVYAQPDYPGRPADQFYTGPDGPGRAQLEQLIRLVGLTPVWVGDHDKIALVDNLGALWVHLVFRMGHGRSIAVGLLRR